MWARTLVAVLLSLPTFLAAEPSTLALGEAGRAQSAVESIFRSALTPDQAATVKPGSSLPLLAALLTPEEKGTVRSGLSKAEENAKTVDELREIARGYQVLGDSAPDLARIGRRMQELDPKSSEGFS